MDPDISSSKLPTLRRLPRGHSLDAVIFPGQIATSPPKAKHLLTGHFNRLIPAGLSPGNGMMSHKLSDRMNEKLRISPTTMIYRNNNDIF
jgi:hypothetical protein